MREMATITFRGIEGNFDKKLLKCLKQYFTISTYQIIGPPLRYSPICLNSRVLPIFAISTLIENKISVSSNYVLPIYEWSNLIDASFELSFNQLLVCKEVQRNINLSIGNKLGTANILLDMGAGYGKTFIALWLIYIYRGKVLIVCPRIKLVDSFRKTLKLFLPSDIFAGVTVCTINMAMKITETERFDIIILDEVHKYCSVSHRELFWKTNAPIVLGMTATPIRIDGMSNMLKWFLPRRIVANTLVGWLSDEVKFNLNVKSIHYFAEEEYSQIYLNSQGFTDCRKSDQQFCSDPQRCELVWLELCNLYKDSKNNIFVFSVEVAPLTELMRKCKLNNFKAIEYHDKAMRKHESENRKKVRRGEVEENFLDARIFLSTFSFAGTGTSISKMNCIIFLTPMRNNYLQYVARILRRDGDVSVPRHIVDIIDERCSLRAQYNQRKKSYLFYGADICDVNFG